jgi:hypothetical protein
MYDTYGYLHAHTYRMYTYALSDFREFIPGQHRIWRQSSAAALSAITIVSWRRSPLLDYAFPKVLYIDSLQD